ncbi:hypothetical protein V8E52_010738 [Russula decolorans]
MDRISRSFRAGSSQSPARARAIIIRPMPRQRPPLPLLLYMSLVRLLTPTPSPAPTSVPTSKQRSRKPSPLTASTASTSPASPVALLDPISATRSSPVASESTNANSSSSQLHIIIDPSPPPRHPRAKSGGGGSGKGRHFLPRHQVMSSDTSAVIVIRSSTVRTTRHRAPRTVQDRPRNVQKNKDRAASSKEMGPLPQIPPAPADHLSYNHAEGDDFLSYLEAGPSSKESSLTLMADSRSVTPGTKPAYDDVAH